MDPHSHPWHPKQSCWLLIEAASILFRRVVKRVWYASNSVGCWNENQCKTRAARYWWVCSELTAHTSVLSNPSSSDVITIPPRRCKLPLRGRQNPSLERDFFHFVLFLFFFTCSIRDSNVAHLQSGKKHRSVLHELFHDCSWKCSKAEAVPNAHKALCTGGSM